MPGVNFIPSVAMILSFIFNNFALMLFDVAVVAIIVHRMRNKNLPESEITFRWLSLIALGLTSLYAAVSYAWFPAFSAMQIGWTASPFQLQVAMANLAFAILGISAYRASFGYRCATVVGSACWLWGSALGHYFLLNRTQAYTLFEMDSWFWMDLVLPVLLILTVSQLKKNK